MTNRFRRVSQLEVVPDNIQRMNIGDLTLGTMLNKSARVIPLGASVRNALIRFDDGALRKDFGTTAIGAVAPQKIVGIGEHKYILNMESFSRLIRLYVDAGALVLEIWDGTDWLLVDSYTPGVEGAYLSIASSQNRFIMADGEKILVWYESLDTEEVGQDFPNMNSLENVGDETSIVVTPAGAVDNKYRVAFSVDLEILRGSGYTIVVSLFHESIEVGSRSFNLESGIEAWINEFFEFTAALIENSTITLQVVDVSSETVPQHGHAWGSGDKNLVATKSIEASSINGRYVYRYEVIHSGDDFTVEYFYREIDTDPWTSLGTFVHTAADAGLFERNFNIGDLPSGAQWAVDIIQSGPSPAIIDNPPTGDGIEYSAYNPGTDFNLTVKGYNQEDDGDVFPGLMYLIPIDVFSVFELLSPIAPGARFILPFGDRLLAYRDAGDHQVAAWSADGQIDVWYSADPDVFIGDAGETVLLDTRSDGIDNLMGAAVLNAGTVAVFRKRSIMRAQETGSIALAMGHFHWIENLGTESPFSIQSTAAGIIFLGHDLDVYLLTDQGLRPIGTPIHRELIARLTSNLDLVDSAFDPVFQEYYLGVPEDNALGVTGTWIFKLRDFLLEQKLVWRYRPGAVERFAVVSVIE